jgi:hypothetical protein
MEFNRALGCVVLKASIKEIGNPSLLERLSRAIQQLDFKLHSLAGLCRERASDQNGDWILPVGKAADASHYDSNAYRKPTPQGGPSLHRHKLATGPSASWQTTTPQRRKPSHRTNRGTDR